MGSCNAERFNIHSGRLRPGETEPLTIMDTKELFYYLGLSGEENKIK